MTQLSLGWGVPQSRPRARRIRRTTTWSLARERRRDAKDKSRVIRQCSDCGAILTRTRQAIRRGYGWEHACTVVPDNVVTVICPGCLVVMEPGHTNHCKRYRTAWTMRRYYGDPDYRQLVIVKSSHRGHARRARAGGGAVGEGIIDIVGLIERDGPACYLCGKVTRTEVERGHPDKAEIEHMTPTSRGGGHTLDNVAVACGDCNRRKHARTADEWRAS